MARYPGPHEIRAAYVRAAAAIEALPDPQEAFEQATELRETLDELVGLAAKLRARTVKRIYRPGRMTVAVLAVRLGVSKARAGQLLRAADEP